MLDNVSFTIRPREKVALIGTDALAKTTLFKILAGELEPDEGSFKWGRDDLRFLFADRQRSPILTTVTMICSTGFARILI